MTARQGLLRSAVAEGRIGERYFLVAWFGTRVTAANSKDLRQALGVCFPGNKRPPKWAIIL
ncbi:hypothetical protein MnTg02_00601 [bacterium MnTg02]|nr:hypothetical protein MnTg02_00601 [bacterium MnTg02]